MILCLYAIFLLHGAVFAGVIPPPPTDLSSWQFLDELKSPYKFQIGGMMIGGNVGEAFDQNVVDDSKSPNYYVVQDGKFGPVLMPVRVEFSADGWEGLGIQVPVMPLLDPEGNLYRVDSEIRQVRPQSLAFSPLGKHLWYVTEDENGVSSFREMGFEGMARPGRDFSGSANGPIPDYHRPDAPAENQKIGVRRGLGYSGITFTPGGVGEIVSAGPFVQNGPPPTNSVAAPVIITYFNADKDESVQPQVFAEHVYMLGPVPDGFDSAVVAENLALDDSVTLYLETYENTQNPDSPWFASALYSVDRSRATNVLGEASIVDRVGVDLVPVTKTKIMDMDEETMKSMSDRNQFPIDRLSNMAHGPSLEDGRRLLIIASNSEQLGRPRFHQSLVFTY